MPDSHRVLFFVEPYVVRSGPEDFRTPLEIFRDIASMLALEPGIQCAIITNSVLAPRIPPHVRCYTPASFGITEAMSKSWQDHWIKMLKGEPVGQWGDFYRHVLSDFAPTRVYAWNKNSLFASACRDAKVGAITFEYGGTRTPSGFRISIDPLGFGPDSALAREQLAPRDDRSRDGWQWAAEHVYRDALLNRAPHVELSHHRDSGELRVCVLLQKEDDVNFLVWPAFAEMSEFVDQVLTELSSIDGVHATVRPHPAGLEDYSKRIAAKFPRVAIDDGHYDFSQLVLGFDAVITLNSAGGFEALLCNVPAMSLSQGFYTCAHRSAPGSLGVKEFIALVRSGKFWTDEKRREVGSFTHRLVCNYSIPIDLLRHPGFHRTFLAETANLHGDALVKWFAEDPPRLAQIVGRCTIDSGSLEISGLRVQNHLRTLTDHQLATRLAETERRLHALLDENHQHNQVFAAMTQENAARGAAIAKLDATIPRLDASIEHLAALITELSRQNASRDAAIAQLSSGITDMTAHNEQRDAAIAHLASTLSEMTQQNQQRDAAIAHLASTLSEMTQQNQQRDAAIAHLASTHSEMTQQSDQRDAAIAHVASTLSEMTQQNQQRDAAIAHISATLAEMTRQNQQRDQAIHTLSDRVPAPHGG